MNFTSSTSTLPTFAPPSFAPSFPSATATPPPNGAPDDDELGNWSSLIGIITAIVGNVLIALALNVQRYAHIRLHRQRAQIKERAKLAMQNAANGSGLGRGGGGGGGVYGATANRSNGTLSRRNTGGSRNDAIDAHETEPLNQSFRSTGSDCSGDDDSKVASTYLKDPYWWLGQVLITIGEMGNFLAYGFAPASIVSPLGVVALVSNCVIAPIVFKEVFRQRDFWGVIIAVGGAVTVVWSANQQETKLEPHDVWSAITTLEFEIYMGVTCSLIVLLMWLSPRYGNRTILIDLGLVGLFGGYTALATKGVSSMLSSTLLGAFTTPVTYALLFILLSTAVMQVRFVNKALQRFDSTQVIPIQFVLFTLCVIIGSAVLYRDFERTSAEQAVKFVGGCLLTFFGVFLITSGRPRHDEDEETLSDVEGVEETIGLSEQDPVTPQTPLQSSRRNSEARSRRSSRASRISFKEQPKSLTVLADTGIPSLRVPPASNSKTPLLLDGGEDSPLENPWRDGIVTPVSPGFGAQALSSESVTTVNSLAVSDSSLQAGGALNQAPQLSQNLSLTIPQLERPVTPRASMSASRPHSHHFNGPVYSPSPFSSTLSAVVADKLLGHIESPTIRRMLPRRSRPSLRNSLFVPQDELDDEEAQFIASAVEQYRTDQELDADESSSSQAKQGFRGRARSLSHTLGELFGVKRKVGPSDNGAEDEQGRARRPRAGSTQSDCS